MNIRQKLVGILGTVLICTIMAAAAASAVAQAAGLGANALQSCLCALFASVACGAFAISMPAGIVAVCAAFLGAGAAVAMGISGGLIATIKEGFSAAAGGDMTVLAGAGGYLTGAASAILSLVFYSLINDNSRATTTMAVAMCLCAALVPGAIGGEVNAAAIGAALVGCLAAIAHTSEQRRTGGHLLAFVPAAMAVLMAFLLAPGEGTMWEPLEEAAEKVRNVYEDYFNYTSERVTFSISQKGYDYYGLRGDEPTHMLGGPADPDTDAVMLVKTDDDVLLRGSVRSEYTGWSWEDNTPRARNLYYDFTRRTRRKAVFGADIMEQLDRDEAFREVSGEVSMISDSSPTLFTPGRLADFQMDMKNAVYYNSVGEIFLARDVEKGDGYSFAGWELEDIATLDGIARVEDDRAYNEAQAGYLMLPKGIEKGVYSVAEALTQGCETDVQKVIAIIDGLAANCNYETQVDYPPQDRDFVSYFLLDSREGYCSYFASAMAVMCRMEGIPARYIEGYRVYAESDGVTTVTGEDAHAWVEVYLDGIGWVACDPTPGEDEDRDGDNSPDPAGPVDTEPTPDPTPEPPMDGEMQDEPTPEPTMEPTMEPDTGVTPPPEHPEMPDDEPEPPVQERKKVGPWIWIVLVIIILALIIAAAWLFIKRRLKMTDPIMLAASRDDEDEAAMVLYRSMLTLLSHIGHGPISGETPEAFAARLSKSGLDNPDFAEFARRTSLARYSGAGFEKEDVAYGNRAYVRFRRHMRRGERIKFDAYRVLRGLGDFESIP